MLSQIPSSPTNVSHNLTLTPHDPLTPGSEINPDEIRELSGVTSPETGDILGINDVRQPEIFKITEQNGNYYLREHVALTAHPNLNPQLAPYVNGDGADYEALTFDYHGRIVASTEGNLQKPDGSIQEDKLYNPALVEIDPNTGQVKTVVPFPDEIARLISHNKGGEALLAIHPDSILAQQEGTKAGFIVGLEEPLNNGETQISLFLARSLDDPENPLSLTGARFLIDPPIPGIALRELKPDPRDPNSAFALFTGYDPEKQVNFSVI